MTPPGPELAYLKANYPILALVRELQDARGYEGWGLVMPDAEVDQKTRCPIHSDGQPSAKAYFRSNSIYCFTCGKTWDPPGLYAAFYSVTLGAAMRVLLERLGQRATPQTASAAEGKLRNVIGKLQAHDPSAGHEADAIERWANEVRLWAGDMVWCSQSNWGAFADVEDAVEWSAGMDPAERAGVIRRYLSWAHRVHPDAPTGIVEDPATMYLLGVPHQGG